MNHPLVQYAIGIWCFFHAFSVASPLVFPEPEGEFKVNFRSYELVDRSRLDPYNKTHLRRLMISRFDPVSKKACKETHEVRYMPARTAKIVNQDLEYYYNFPKGVVERARLQVCKSGGAEHSHPLNVPLLIFSPGHNSTRLAHSGMAQQVASRGYTVLTVDHPYDALAVEFPDGDLVRVGEFPDLDSYRRAVEVRVDDIFFLLESLRLPKLTPRRPDQRVGIFGHSLGGNTAGTVMAKEPRIAGGVNLDGSFFDNVAKMGFGSQKFPQSFLLWGFEGHDTDSDPSWDEFWRNMEKAPHDAVWKKELSLVNATHRSFTDYPVLVELGNLRDKVGNKLGTINGTRNSEILGTYLASFFDLSLLAEDDGLLRRPSEEYPEVLFFN